MDWFSVGLDSLTVAGHGILLLFFSSRFTRKKIHAHQGGLFLLLLYGLVAAAVALDLRWMDTMLELALLYGYNRFALRNGRAVSCVTTFLAAYVVMFSFGMINPLEMLLFPGVLGKTSLLYLLILLALVLAFTLCFFCYKYMVKHFSIREGQKELYVGLLLTPCLFIFAVQFYISYTTYGKVPATSSVSEPGKHLVLLGLQALGLGALFSVLYAYQRTCEAFQARAALASLTQETRAQRTYVAEAQARYERTRAFRHDLKSHLSVLDGLLKAGDRELAQNYLRKLDAATGELSFPVHTNHPVVDILLGEKLTLARAQGTMMEFSLSLPHPCAVDDLDLCVIFANALNNALHACTRVEKSSFIRVTGLRQGDFYMLEFENTCHSSPPESRQVDFGRGLSNIKAVAEKYGGTISIEKGPSLFQLNVLLNISRQPNDSSGQVT